MGAASGITAAAPASISLRAFTSFPVFLRISVNALLACGMIISCK